MNEEDTTIGEIGSGNNSSYPGALDTNAIPEVNSPAAGKTKARKEVVEDLTDGLIKVETELGTDPAGSLTDVKTFLQTHHQTDGTHKSTHGTHKWLDEQDYANFTTAVAAAANKTLVVARSITLDANTTIGASVSLMPINPGIINANGYTLTINGPVVGNPMHQWLNEFAAGEVIFGNLYTKEVIVEWFGALANGSTDCYAAIMLAIKSLIRGGKVLFGKGIYKTTNTIVIDVTASNTEGRAIILIGVDDRNTIIVHTGTQTTGTIYVEMLPIWNGSNYSFDVQAPVQIINLSAGSSYGPAITSYLGTVYLDGVTTFAAGATHSNIIYKGTGGRVNKTFFNSSQSGFSYSPYYNEVVALLPLGSASLIPQNSFTVTSTIYNDGTHGPLDMRALELWVTNSGSGSGSTGPSILIGTENGATAPGMIHFNMCKFTGGTQVGGGNEPVVVKITAGQQIFFDHCNLEPAVSSGVMTSLEIDAIDGETEVYLSNCYQESSGYIDVGDISDTTTTRTYQASLHVDHSRFYGVRLNSKMVTDGDILSMVLEDSIFNVDITNLLGAKATILNLEISNCYTNAITPIGNIFQSFLLYIYNDGGTVKHLIGSDQVNQAVADYATRINEATNVATVTPTGTDSSTAMAGGGKISSANVNRFILDNIKDQLEPRASAVSSVINYNDTGTALVVSGNQVSRNVNGVTRKRIELYFSNSTTGAAYDLTAIPLNKGIMIKITGYMF